MPKYVPISSPSLAPVATPRSPAPEAMPPISPMSKSSAPIPPRISRDEGYVEILWRTRGETYAMRDASREYVYRYGLLLDHVGVASMLATSKSNNEPPPQHNASRNSPDVPAAHESNFPTPNIVSDVDMSPHADIWRHSKHQEFSSLLSLVPSPRRRHSNKSQT